MTISKVSATTVTALLVVYRQVILVLFAFPLVIVPLAVSLSWALRLMDFITHNHSLLVLGTTAILTNYVTNYIATVAPSKEEAIESVQKIKNVLIVFMLAASYITLNLVWMPIESQFRLEEKVRIVLPCLSLSTAFRLALGSILLGLSVVARYIGPQSFVRCSSSPLRGSPRISISSFRHLTQPDDETTSEFNRPQYKQQQHHQQYQTVTDPRREQDPKFTSVMVQYAISTFLSVSLAYVLFLPMPFFGNDADEKERPSSITSLILLCFFSTLTQLTDTMVIGTEHEIDPAKHQYLNVKDYASIIRLLKAKSGTLAVEYLLAIAVYKWCNYLEYNPNMIYFVVIPPVILSYLTAFDFVLRSVFCKKSINIKMAAEEASGGYENTYLDVVLHSILHSSDVLVRMIANKPPVSTTLLKDIEQEEVKRNEKAVKLLVDILLWKSTDDEAAPHLEDDVLRLAIFNSMGSPNTSEKILLETFSSENEILPIARAFCCYLQSLAEALVLICENKMNQNYQLWFVSNGTIYLAECAIRTMTNLLLKTFNESITSKRSVVEILVPVFINAVFKLQLGILRFIEYKIAAQNGVTPMDRNEKLMLLRTEYPRFEPLFDLCIDSAVMCVKKLASREQKSVSAYLSTLEDLDCRLWIGSKV